MKVPEFEYRTPVIRYDPLAQVQIYERRNPTTGDVSYQVPSVAAVRQLQDNRPSTEKAEPVISFLV
jgi:hypothetical protein